MCGVFPSFLFYTNCLSLYHTFFLHCEVESNFVLFILDLLVSCLQWICRESEGTFQYGNYSGEVEDLRSVVEYFNEVHRGTAVVLGHSKGTSQLDIFDMDQEKQLR